MKAVFATVFSICANLLSALTVRFSTAVVAVPTLLSNTVIVSIIPPVSPSPYSSDLTSPRFCVVSSSQSANVVTPSSLTIIPFTVFLTAPVNELLVVTAVIIPAIVLSEIEPAK